MKVGDYVRTKWGCIAKFEGINEGVYEFDNIIMDESSAVREELLVDIVEKSSPNIIDLIEVGDVLHYEFYGIDDISMVDKENNKLGIGWDEDGDWISLKDVEVKSIVTHEQFSQMEYRIGE